MTGSKVGNFSGLGSDRKQKETAGVLQKDIIAGKSLGKRRLMSMVISGLQSLVRTRRVREGRVEFPL